MLVRISTHERSTTGKFVIPSKPVFVKPEGFMCLRFLESLQHILCLHETLANQTRANKIPQAR